MKPIGSENFGTSVVRTEEYILLAKVMVADGDTIEVAAEKISFIDDCLAMLRMRSINNAMRRTAKGNLRRDSEFSRIIDARLDMLMANLKGIEP